MNKLIMTLVTTMLILAGCNGLAKEVKDVAEEAGDVSHEVIEQTEDALQTAEQGAENLEQQTASLMKNVKERLIVEEKELDQEFVSEGEQAVLNETAFIALNNGAYDELYGWIEMDQKAENTKEIATLREDNQILLAESGTAVKVLDTDITEAKVEVVTTGEVGYIHLGLLKQVGKW